MGLFERKFPHLAYRLEGVTGSAQKGIEVASRSADWEALVGRWLGAATLKADTAYALSGLGNGLHVQRVLEVLPKGAVLFCAERELETAKAFIESAEGEAILRDERFYLGVGELNDDFFASLSRFPVLEIENAEPLVFAPFYELDGAYYGKFFGEFARGVDYWRKLRGTNVVYSGDWQSNTLQNMRRMAGCPDLRELEGLFAGRTMILVSAGPSLDEVLPLIAEARDKAVVVAVNSSYRALRNAGIRPHFVMAADPYEHTAKGFEGVETEGTILVAPFIVYPKVAELFEGRTVSWSENNALATHFREVLNLGVGSRVTEQGTVSACGFDLASVLGCQRMLLVGQDLAARADGQTHATDSFYTGEGLNFTDVESCRWMPGNTIEKVPVESKLYVYLKTFEQLALRFGRELELLNASRLGARIEGIPYVEPEAAFARLNETSFGWDLEERFLEVFDDVGKMRAEGALIAEEIGELSEYLKSVSSRALAIAMDLEIQPEDREIEDLAKKEGELQKWVRSNANYERILGEGQLKLELHLFQKEMREMAGDLSDGEKKAETLKGYCWALAEGAFRLYCDSRTGMSESTHEANPSK